MNWREPEHRGQAYTPRVSSAAETFPGAGEAQWDHAARVYDGVEPGEVEALLRVERSA